MTQNRLKAQLLSNTALQTTEVLLANVFLAAVNAAVFWQSIPQAFLMVWGASLLFICLFRGCVAYAYIRNPQRQSLSAWNLQMIIASTLQGIAWGVFSLIAYRYLSLGEMVIVIMTAAGMTAGAVASTSSSIAAFLGFSVTTLMPLALTFLSSDHLETKAAGFLVCLFFLLTLRQTRTINQILINSISSNLELEKANQRGEKLAKELYQLSTMDALTLVANRRGFDEALAREWQRAKRTESALTLIIIDVDNFKTYNDKLGHQAGDKCLQDIAVELSHHARRAGDVVARYGGEEFALIMPDLHDGEGVETARTICRDIERLKIKHPESNCSSFVTVSAGVHSTVPKRFEDSEQLVKYADVALYQAKAEGRNRATRFTGTSSG